MARFEYIEEIKPFFWWTGSLSIEQALDWSDEQ